MSSPDNQDGRVAAAGYQRGVDATERQALALQRALVFVLAAADGKTGVFSVAAGLEEQDLWGQTGEIGEVVDETVAVLEEMLASQQKIAASLAGHQIALLDPNAVSHPEAPIN